jgi:arylsulfatase A-like enzyme
MHALVLLAALAACGRDVAPPGVVLVSIDTLRADHLGFHGYPHPTSPFMDALARESTVFENAVPTCPATAPSIASLLTGVHRNAHGARRNGAVLRDDATTLAERLHAAGYRTLARGSNPVLGPRQGFAQGFDVFSLPDYSRESAGSAAVARDATALLHDVGDRPFFLWVHFIDPHGPYVAPERYRSLFPATDYRREGDVELPVSTANYGLHVIPAYTALPGIRDPAEYRARYDAEIRYVDDGVRTVVEALRAHGLWDHVVFVLTADHGESLGEHDYWFQHGFFTYDDCLHVPLLIHGPAVPGGRRVRASVSLVDVVPTILELVRLPPAPDVAGRSLVPLVHGDETADRAAFAQTYYGSQQYAMRVGPTKIIVTPARTGTQREPAPTPGELLAPPHERVELYDLAADPGELHDLSRQRPDETKKLKWQVSTWLVAQQPRGAPTVEANEPPDVDPELQQNLRALGYVN